MTRFSSCVSTTMNGTEEESNSFKSFRFFIVPLNHPFFCIVTAHGTMLPNRYVPPIGCNFVDIPLNSEYFIEYSPTRGYISPMNSTPHAQVISEDVRQQILEAAFTRFGHYGYNKTTMAEIAEDTGMSAANLYRYFENKQEIAAACASRCMCKRIDLLRDTVRKTGHSASERLNNYVMTMLIDCHQTYSDETKINEVVTFITNERPDLVYQKIEAQHSLISEILAYGNQTGEFDVEDVITTAKSIYTAVVVFDVPIFMPLYPLEEFKEKARNVVKLLLEGLKKR